MLFDGILLLKPNFNYQTNNNYRKIKHIHIRKINRMRSTIQKQRVNKQCSKFSTHRQKIKEKIKKKSENVVTELFETDLI